MSITNERRKAIALLAEFGASFALLIGLAIGLFTVLGIGLGLLL